MDKFTKENVADEIVALAFLKPNLCRDFFLKLNKELFEEIDDGARNRSLLTYVFLVHSFVQYTDDVSFHKCIKKFFELTEKVANNEINEL